MGEETNLRILQLHLATNTTESEQVALMRVILQTPFPRNEALATASVELLSHLLPKLMGNHDTAIWSSWQVALYGEAYPHWVQGTTQAVGQFAATDPSIARAIVQDLFTHQGERLRRSLVALDAMIRAAAYRANPQTQIRLVFTQMLQHPIPSLSSTYLSAIVRFLRHVADACTPQEQDYMAAWVQENANPQPKLFVPLLEALADESPIARAYLPTLIAQLPAQEAAYQFNRLLRFQPISQHPPLKTLDQPSQVFLVKFYRQQIPTVPDAAIRLLEAAQFSKSKEVAVAAAQSLPEIATSVAQMLPLLESNFTGVRDNALQAIAKLTESELQLRADELQQICLRLKSENDQAVGRLLCEVVARWVQHYRQVPAAVPGVIGQLPTRLLQKGTLDGGVARVLILAMKAIAQSEPEHLEIQLFNQQVSQLLNAINLVRVMRGEAEMLDLLCALKRLNQNTEKILVEIVQQDCPDLARKGWERNIYAVIRAIKRTENEYASILDEIMASPWCTQGITNCILETKGI